MPIKGDTLYPFKWFFRPEGGGLVPAMMPMVPVVQIVEDAEELSREELASALAEIDSRHWRALRQILIECKYKAESQLRSDAIIKDPQLSAHYQGWVNYADYILANFEGLRAGEPMFSATPYQSLSGEVR